MVFASPSQPSMVVVGAVDTMARRVDKMKMEILGVIVVAECQVD